MSLSRKFFTIALILFLSIAFLQAERGLPASAALASSGRVLRFTVLYDNYLHKEGTKLDWGLSFLIEGTEKTILFDTGTDPRILMNNVSAMSIRRPGRSRE